MTIGIFDGVHRGHAELLRRVVRKGKNPTVVTFRENPKKFFEPQNYPGDIFSLEQKLSAFKILGIEQIILIDFSEYFSRLKWEEFISLLHERGNMCFLVIGSGFRCGHRLDADAAFIKSMNEAKGIPTEIIPPLGDDFGSISSSRIRAAIIQGDLPLATALLGRNIELDLAPGVSELWDDGEGLVFEINDRLVPPPGQYRALLELVEQSDKQVWEGEIVIGIKELIIPFSRNRPLGYIPGLKFNRRIKIRFLNGPKAQVPNLGV